MEKKGKENEKWLPRPSFVGLELKQITVDCVKLVAAVRLIAIYK